MAQAFEELSETDLLFIVESSKLTTIVDELGQPLVTNLLANLPSSAIKKLPNNKISQSLLSTLIDAPSYPLIILWTLVGLVSLSIIPLTLITVGFFILSLLAGGIYFYSNYKELKKEVDKSDQFFQSLLLQIQCLDELIKRKNAEMQCELSSTDELDSLAQHLSIKSLAKSLSQDKNKWTKIKNAIGSTTMMASILFGTYYLGVGGVIAAFGLTAVASAMLGPIGIGIALGISLLIGIYFGYKCYQAERNADVVKQQQKQLMRELETKQKHYENLTARVELIKNQKMQNENKQPGKNKIQVKPKMRRIASSHYRFSLYPMLLLSRRRVQNKKPVNFPPKKHQKHH